MPIVPSSIDSFFRFEAANDETAESAQFALAAC